jgi:hypothetical protein
VQADVHASGNYVQDKKLKTMGSKPKSGKSMLSFEPKAGICFSACYLPLNFVKWGDMKPDSYWGMKVGSDAWLTSVVACMDTYCSVKQADDGWERLAYFLALSDTETALPPYADVLARIDYGMIPDVNCLDAEAQQHVYNSTILSIHDNFENGWRTDVSEFQEKLQLMQH